MPVLFDDKEYLVQEEYPVEIRIGCLVITALFISTFIGLIVGFYFTMVSIEKSCNDLKQVTVFGKHYICKPVQEQQAIGRKVNVIKRNKVCT